MAQPLAARTYPTPVGFETGPFTGMNDASEPTAAAEGRCALAQNVYLAPGPSGTAYIGRPGFTLMGTALTQLGSAGKRTVQYVGELVTADGVRHCCAIVGGQFYTYDWSTGAFTESVTAANFTTKVITVSQTARIYGTPFFSKLLFNDGANTPWAWDGSSGSGSLTKLANCPSLYGQPVIYYGTYAGVKSTDHTTFVWSEIGDATLGYDTAPYANAWTLVSTGSERLTALGARNEALTVFRERQCQRVVGAVTTDFQTAGTQADGAIDEGTSTPSVFEVGQGTLFVDADAAPYLLPTAGDPVPLWQWSQQTTRTVARSSLDRVQFVAHPELNLVLIALPEPNQSECTLCLVYGADTLSLQAVWRGFTMQRLAVVRDTNGSPRIIHGETDGRLYVHGTPEGGPWNDAFAAGESPIAHEVTTAPMGYDIAVEKRWTDLDLGLVGANLTSVAVDYETPRGGPAMPITKTVNASSAVRYDTGVQYDSGARYVSVTPDRRARAGINGWGRWLKASVRHAALDEQFGLTLVRARGYQIGSEYSIP